MADGAFWTLVFLKVVAYLVMALGVSAIVAIVARIIGIDIGVLISTAIGHFFGWVRSIINWLHTSMPSFLKPVLFLILFWLVGSFFYSWTYGIAFACDEHGNTYKSQGFIESLGFKMMYDIGTVDEALDVTQEEISPYERNDFLRNRDTDEYGEVKEILVSVTDWEDTQVRLATAIAARENFATGGLGRMTFDVCYDKQTKTCFMAQEDGSCSRYNDLVSPGRFQRVLLLKYIFARDLSTTSSWGQGYETGDDSTNSIAVRVEDGYLYQLYGNNGEGWLSYIPFSGLFVKKYEDCELSTDTTELPDFYDIESGQEYSYQKEDDSSIVSGYIYNAEYLPLAFAQENNAIIDLATEVSDESYIKRYQADKDAYLETYYDRDETSDEDILSVSCVEDENLGFTGRTELKVMGIPIFNFTYMAVLVVGFMLIGMAKFFGKI